MESAIRQTYKELEIIIVDDGSTDDTENTVREYQKENGNIRYIKHAAPKGPCAARNHGILEAHGEFIAGLDDDDEWLPRRVEVLLENYSDEYAYLCSEDLIVERNGKERRRGRSIIRLEDMLYKNITGNQILTKRERILAVGGFDEGLSSAQDYDLWLRLLERYGPAKRVPEVLHIVYRNHDTQRVSLARGKVSGEWNLYKKHKSKMNRSQRRVHLLELKRLKHKKLKLAELLSISEGRYFKPYAIYYIRRALGRI
jgi:glycosyltransferase involved in cell wall biosynthesis